MTNGLSCQDREDAKMILGEHGEAAVSIITESPYSIRWMETKDMAEVMSIEVHSFELSWSEENFQTVFRYPSCVPLVIVDMRKNRIAGFVIYTIRQHNVLCIETIAVAPSYRRKGVGTFLMNRIHDTKDCDMIYCHIPEDELGALLFFKHLGYRAEGVHRGYFAGLYGEPHLDSIEMVLRNPAGKKDENTTSASSTTKNTSGSNRKVSKRRKSDTGPTSP